MQPEYCENVPPTPALDFVLLLTRANAAANSSLDRALSRVGLWLNDLSLLTFVRDAGPGGLSRSALAAALFQSQSETLRRVRQMEKLNWIERTDHGNFALTAHGRTVIGEGTGLAENKSEAWLEAMLSGEEIDVLRSLLRKLL